MEIPYSLIRTQLKGQEFWVGRIHHWSTYDSRGLAQRMADRRSNLRVAEILAFLDLLSDTIQLACAEGRQVKIDGLVQFSTALGGTFDGARDQVLKGRNELRVTASVGKETQRAVARKVQLTKRSVPEPRPLVSSVRVLGEPGSKVFHEGDLVEIRGAQLSFNSQAPDEGVFIADSEDRNQRVKIEKILKALPSSVLCVVPRVPFASGSFDVTSRLDSKTLKTGVGKTAEFSSHPRTS